MHGFSHTHSHETVTPTTGRTIRWAQQYDFLVRVLMLGQERRFRQRILQQAAIPSNAIVLDVGCGTGTLALMTKAQLGNSGKMYGIDASPQMIDVARQKAQHQRMEVNFQQGVIEALPFPDNSFDVVLSTLMFHHLPDDLKRRGLEEVYRVLKPGGYLFLVDAQQPTTLMGSISMRLMFHHRVTDTLRDYLPAMETIGYDHLQTGQLVWNFLGFVRASRP